MSHKRPLWFCQKYRRGAPMCAPDFWWNRFPEGSLPRGEGGFFGKAEKDERGINNFPGGIRFEPAVNLNTIPR